MMRLRNWLWIAAMLLMMFLWTLFIYTAVGDNPRNWDYGTHPYLGAESPLTSVPVVEGPANTLQEPGGSAEGVQTE